MSSRPVSCALGVPWADRLQFVEAICLPLVIFLVKPFLENPNNTVIIGSTVPLPTLPLRDASFFNQSPTTDTRTIRNGREGATATVRRTLDGQNWKSARTVAYGFATMSRGFTTHVYSRTRPVIVSYRVAGSQPHAAATVGPTFGPTTRRLPDRVRPRHNELPGQDNFEPQTTCRRRGLPTLFIARPGFAG